MIPSSLPVMRLPSLNHVISGVGVPVAGHGRTTLLPSMMVVLVGVDSGMLGASVNVIYIQAHQNICFLLILTNSKNMFSFSICWREYFIVGS